MLSDGEQILISGDENLASAGKGIRQDTFVVGIPNGNRRRIDSARDGLAALEYGFESRHGFRGHS